LAKYQLIFLEGAMSRRNNTLLTVGETCGNNKKNINFVAIFDKE